MKQFFLVLFVVFLANFSTAIAKEYEIFDGRNYNGKYYPRIDIITWRYDKTENYTQQFQIYWKGHPIEMSFALEEKDGQKILLIRYNIKERKEILCRRAPAPMNFGQGFKVYLETKDKDMDNYILSMTDLPAEDGRKLITPPKYEACPEEPEEEEKKSPQITGTPSDFDPFQKVPTKSTATSKEEKKVEPAQSDNPVGGKSQDELNEQYNYFGK